jgi:hypothetical protein
MRLHKLTAAVTQSLGIVSLGIAASALVLAPSAAHAEKSPHSFKGELGLDLSSNTNISLAPAAGPRFDFASVSDFDSKDEEEGDGEEDEDEDDEDEGFDFDDLDGGAEYSEDELEESDNPDEDGDGIDDLIDDDQDGGDGEDIDDGDGDDGDGDGDDDEGGSDSKGYPAKASKRSDENRYTAKFGFGHKYKFDKHTWATGAKLSLDQQPDRDELDKLNVAFATGPQFKLSKRAGMKVQASYISLRQDDNKFLRTWVGTVGFDFQINKVFGVDVAYNYQDKDVTEPAAPDAIVNTLTFGAEWKVSDNDILRLKYSPKVEDASINSRNKDTRGFQIAYSRKIPKFGFFGEGVLGIGYKTDTVEYENLPKFRKDETDGYGVQYETEFSKKVSASLAYDVRKRDSNINSKDGRNRSWVLSFGYKF